MLLLAVPRDGFPGASHLAATFCALPSATLQVAALVAGGPVFAALRGLGDPVAGLLLVRRRVLAIVVGT